MPTAIPIHSTSTRARAAFIPSSLLLSICRASSCCTCLRLWFFCLSTLSFPFFTAAQSNGSTGSGFSSTSNPTLSPISLSTAFLRILGALGLGGLIGLEREITNITRRLRGMAGIRTHAVICTGSCLIQLVSVYAYADISGYSTNRDPSRLAAQAVSGIGFVGAGAILKGGENVIYGLTSAASIWLVMGVGLAIGLGYWAVTCLTVALVVVAMVVTKRAEHVVFGRRYGPGYTAEMEVVSKSGPDELQHIIDSVGRQLHITTMSLDRQHRSDKQQPTPNTDPTNPKALSPHRSTPTAPTAAPAVVSGSLAAISPSSAEPSPPSSVCAKFVVELDNCSRQSFLSHLQLTVMLLCEDADVYRVESRNVQEAKEGPSHRLQWTVPSQHERQQLEHDLDRFKQEVRQRRVQRQEKLAVAEEGVGVKKQVAVRVDVEQGPKLRPTTSTSQTSSGAGGGDHD